MPRFTLLLPMRRDGKRLPNGETVELTADEARPLVASGAVAPSDHRPEAAPPPPPVPAAVELPDAAALKRLSKVKIVEQAKAEGLELDANAKQADLITALITARKPPADPPAGDGEGA